jgi:PIN domain
MRDKERKDTGNFIDACIIEPVTREVARTAGELYRKHRAAGLTLTSIDCLIAATAAIPSPHLPIRVFLLRFGPFPEPLLRQNDRFCRKWPRLSF